MKFILTRELGRLAKWLRILGFDARYFRESKGSSLAIEALREDRIILTRNLRLGERLGLRKLNIEHDSIYDQIRQILTEFAIRPDEKLMFSRCTICNETLLKAEKDTAKEKVPRYVFEAKNDFFFCPACSRVYWQGSHWGNVAKILKEIQVSI